MSRSKAFRSRTKRGGRLPRRVSQGKRSGSKRGSAAGRNAKRSPRENAGAAERFPRLIRGRYRKAKGGGLVIPKDRRIAPEIRIPRGREGDAADGDIVLVRIAEPARRGRPAGEVIVGLRREGSLETDLEIISKEFDLPGPHSDDAERQARSLRAVPSGADWPDRIDLRDLAVFTIDPLDANDFDDAVSLERLPQGALRLGVHIADVSHYVRSGSVLDAAAAERGTSVYLPGRVINMLPERLADDLSSLRPHEDRLTKSVLMTFGPRARLQKTEISSSVIRSRRRFTYEEVQAILLWIEKGEAGMHLPPDHGEYEGTLKLLSQLRRRLSRARAERGALSFDLPKLKLQIDSRGNVSDLGQERRDEAHQLIEEFMLAANEAVAGYFVDRGLPLVGRVHPPPSREKLDALRELLRVTGFRLRGDGSARDLQRLVRDVSSSPLSPVIQLALLRTMGHAEYLAGADLHFALGTDRYCHFTSPIRRYPDLLVHQILDDHRSGALRSAKRRRWWERRLSGLSERCSELERRAEDAERAMLQLRLVRYLEALLGQEMSAWIISVHAFGFFVRVEKLLVEGLVPVATLGGDFYEFDEERLALFGRRTGRGFRLGDRVQVVLSEVDPDTRRIGFQYAGKRRDRR